MYVKEAALGIYRSYTVDHHQLLGVQGLEYNLRTGAIHAARALLTIEQARLQLATLEGVVAELQSNSGLILEEQDRALRAAEQLREEMFELKCSASS